MSSNASANSASANKASANNANASINTTGSTNPPIHASRVHIQRQHPSHQFNSSPSTPAFSFPSTASATTLQLSSLITTPLTDSSSTYASVTKVCLHISQYVAVMMDGNSFVLHERLFIRDSYRVLTALMKCVREHEDRRCRMLVARCLATFAKAHYVKLRSFGYMDMCGNSDMNYASTSDVHPQGREGDGDGIVNVCVSRSSLEDECSSSTALCLADSALHSQDEGVISSALESLAILCIDANADELLNEINKISGCFYQSIGSRIEIDKVGSIEAEYDPSLDLQEQVLLALSTRIRKLVLLLSLVKKSTHQARCIPFLSVAISRLTVDGLESDDIDTIVKDVIYSILYQGMTNQTDLKLRHACAIGSIRIFNVCAGASWGESLCRLSCRVLLDDIPISHSASFSVGNGVRHPIKNELLEQRICSLCTILIAMRGVTMNDRSVILCDVLEKIYTLPSQVNVSGDDSFQWYPRANLLCEAALRIFVDNWIPESYAQSRFELLQNVMNGHVFEESLYNRADFGVETSLTNRNIADEIVSIFCSCSSLIGARLIYQNKEKTTACIEEWFRCSMLLLDSFVPCLEWIEDRSYIEMKNFYRDIGAAAAVDSFLSLFVQILSAVGLVLPLKEHVNSMSPRRRPLSPTSKFNVSPLSTCEWARLEVIELCNDLMKYSKRKRGTVATRIRLILILASSWAQQHISNGGKESNDIDDAKAREILHLIGEEMGVILQNQALPTTEQLYLCQECLRSIEFIILAIFIFSRGKGNGLKDSSDVVDGLNDLVLLSLEILNDIETKNIIIVSMELLEEYNLLLERLKALIHDEVFSLNEKCLYTDFSTNNFPVFGRSGVSSKGGGNSTLPIPINLFGKGQSRLNEKKGVSQNGKSFHSIESTDILYSSMYWYKVRLQLQSLVSRSFDSDQVCNNSPTLTAIRNYTRLTKKQIVSTIDHKDVTTLWRNALFRLSGSSDPLVLLAGYHVQGRKLFIVFKMFNETPVPIPNGCRLTLSCWMSNPTCNRTDSENKSTHTLINTTESQFVIVKNNIEPGDALSWQICCGDWEPCHARFELEVTIKDVQEEQCHYIADIIGEKEDNGENEADDKDSIRKSDIEIVESDSFVVMDISEDLCEVFVEEEEYTDQTISLGQTFEVSPLLLLEPSKHVFFRDVVKYSVPDEATFWLLWTSMKLNISIVVSNANKIKDECFHSSNRCCFDTAKLNLSHDKDRENVRLGWAFETFSSLQLLIVFTEEKTKAMGVEIRCNSKNLLDVFFASRSQTQLFLDAMLPNQFSIEWENAIFGHV